MLSIQFSDDAVELLLMGLASMRGTMVVNKQGETYLIGRTVESECPICLEPVTPLGEAIPGRERFYTDVSSFSTNYAVV